MSGTVMELLRLLRIYKTCHGVSKNCRGICGNDQMSHRNSEGMTRNYQRIIWEFLGVIIELVGPPRNYHGTITKQGLIMSFVELSRNYQESVGILMNYGRTR